MDRLEPGKEMCRSGLLGCRCFGGLVPEPLHTAHSPCGVLLQTEASHHIHDIVWVFWTPVTQGDLGEGRGQVTLPGPAPPSHSPLASGVKPGEAAVSPASWAPQGRTTPEGRLRNSMEGLRRCSRHRRHLRTAAGAHAGAPLSKPPVPLCGLVWDRAARSRCPLQISPQTQASGSQQAEHRVCSCGAGNSSLSPDGWA